MAGVNMCVALSWLYLDVYNYQIKNKILKKRCLKNVYFPTNQDKIPTVYLYGYPNHLQSVQALTSQTYHVIQLFCDLN